MKELAAAYRELDIVEPEQYCPLCEGVYDHRIFEQQKRLHALYFNSLPWRPLRFVHHDAGRCTADFHNIPTGVFRHNLPEAIVYLSLFLEVHVPI